ncbi:MAG: dihydrodipicolinate synthase/N-acetylneuraminate lyase [Verrucomicrobiales bacterium]|jgi:dihydrodipicolinate synthase/N-acetylneuraminate lyase
MTPIYQGIIPPMITPLTGRDTLDVAGLERLVERMIAGGVHGIFALGTSGEAPSLSLRLRREVVERTCQAVAGRVPVLVGITDTSLVESASLAQFASEQGAAAAVTSAPFYFPAGQSELREYIEQLLPELPLPLMLYNMPSMTKVSFGAETVSWALDQPAIIGLKDSSGDLVYFRRMQYLAAECRPDWSLLVGPEELLAEVVLLGGHGGINGGANVHPQLYVGLYNAARCGDLARVRELSAQVMAFSSAIYSIGHYGSAIIKGLKCSLSVLGICDDFMAAPFHHFNAAERQLVEQRLQQLKITS